MTRKNNIKALSLATGTALALGLSSGSVMADISNPFAMSDLSQGYQVSVNDAKCGASKAKEAKCGESKKSAEAKCGGNKAKEAKCGESKKAAEAKCGGNKAKAKEGKCGEAKCGAK